MDVKCRILQQFIVCKKKNNDFRIEVLMEINIIANLGVAVGTILLAFFTALLAFYTYKIIKSSDKQLKLLKHQNRVIKSQQNPFLQVNGVKFNKNSISFKIKNVGLGNAHEIGIYSYFQPVLLQDIGYNNITELFNIPREYMEVLKKFPESKYELLNNLFNEGKLKEWYPNLLFNFNPVQLVDINASENNKILDNGYVSFPESKYPNLIIKPNEAEIELECEPKYCVCYFDTEKYTSSNIYAYNLASKGKQVSRNFNLNELINILEKNKTYFVNFSFKIIYKNQYEEILEPVSLENFVFSVERHHNLEEAFEQGLTCGEFLSHRDIEGKLKGIPYYQYSQEKSSLNYEEEITD